MSCRWIALALAAAPLTLAGCLLEPTDASCAGATTCDGCNDRSGCGWCQSSNTCLPGTSVAPRGAACADWRFAECAAPSATAMANDPNGCYQRLRYCDSCTDRLGNCGWCTGDATCKPATSNGTARDGCTGQFILDESVCRPTICRAQTSCASCIAPPRGVSSCYWCVSSGRCLETLSCGGGSYVSSVTGSCR